MAEQKGIVFFKEIPDRKWGDNPYTGFDVPSQKCLSYSQMNSNLRNLEGRDIKSIDVDENCNPVINLVNGETLTVENASCSGKGGVLKEDLDYSQMFVDGGCCYSTRHFGWLGQYGNTSLGEHYNTNEGDYFPAGTEIEYVLRQILVSKGDLIPKVIVNLSCGSAHKDDNNYLWIFTDRSTTKTGYTFSGTVTVNHTGDDAYVSSCQLHTNDCCGGNKVCLTNLQIKKNGIEMTDYSTIDLTVNIQVNIQAKPVIPTVAEAYFINNINTFLAENPNPTIDDVINGKYVYSQLPYSVQLTTTPQPSGTPVCTKLSPDTPYYCENMVLSDDNPNGYKSALVISNDFKWNNNPAYKVLQYTNITTDPWQECTITGNVDLDNSITGYTIYKFFTYGGIGGSPTAPNVPICFNLTQN